MLRKLHILLRCVLGRHYQVNENSELLMWLGLTLVEDIGYYRLAHNLFIHLKSIKYFKGIKHANEILTGD